MSEISEQDEEHATGARQADERIRDKTVCVIGLGYVGLPLAVEFDREGLDVIGYDVDPKKVQTIKAGTDPTDDLDDETIETSELEATTDPVAINSASYVIVTVPTPVDDLKNPNLRYVEAAGETIGKHISPETTVVLESTVYPGATREILAPAIEATSGLESGEEFHVAYSPERMVPGDDEHGLRDVVKIISGQTEDVCDDVAALYETIVDAGVHRAPEIEVAEAAKAIENVQRDVNIALMNELAIACHNLGLDTKAVLEAAGTKWNFHEYRPGLVGGHCIPVDPFYMIYEAKRNGFSPKLIETAREVNEYMPSHVADITIRGLNECGNILQESTVIVLGLAYKPGVGDVRTSAVDGTIEKLQSFGVEVIGVDPYAEPAVMNEEFDIEVSETASFEGVDGLLLAKPHDPFLELDFDRVASQMTTNPVLIDVDRALNQDQIERAGIAYRCI